MTLVNENVVGKLNWVRERRELMSERYHSLSKAS